MKPRQDYPKLKRFESLEVTKSGVKVGDLYREEGVGIFSLTTRYGSLQASTCRRSR